MCPCTMVLMKGGNPAKNSAEKRKIDIFVDIVLRVITACQVVFRVKQVKRACLFS